MLIVDVSNNNDRSINWERVRAAGIDAAWLKVSEGRTFTDPVYMTYRAGALAAGLRVGGYHYARPDNNPSAATEEARQFARCLGPIGRRDLRPALDLEEHCQLPPARLVEWVRTWNRTCLELTGTGPVLYTYPAYITGDLRASVPLGYGLWLASWGRNDGTEYPYVVPSPWRKAVAHQFTSRARVAGIDGPVDLSSAPRVRPLLAHPVKGLLP